MEKIKRFYNIKKYIDAKKSILIIGPRGCGKSFFVNNFLKKYYKKLVINLLNTEEFSKYIRNPSQIQKELSYKMVNTKNEPLLVFIDEIQRVPALLNEVHLLIEKYKGNIIFILTGSSARKIKKENANLLAARALLFNMYPFNCKEVDFMINFENIMQYGLLPEAFLEKSKDFKEEYLKTYSQMYLKEEIMQESVIRKLGTFIKFLDLSASFNGVCLNFSKFARQIQTTHLTVQNYFQILEDTLLVTKIPGFTHSSKKQLTMASKYYFFDNGVLNALSGELKTQLREGTYRFGKLFETMVVNEIIKYNSINKIDYKLFHYRTSNGLEIDLIIQKNLNTTPIAVEIKSSSSPCFKDVKNILSIKDIYPNARTFVLCRCKNPYIDNGVEFLPYLEGISKIFEI